LVAHAPTNAVATDRVAVSLPFTVGRAGDCGLPVNDQKMSKQHFRIAKDNAGFWVEDVGSTNGTFVQGAPISGTVPLPNQGVIRAGGAVFVFCHDAETMLRPPPAEQ
jgi:pSer/pThr/pTyr-binding forkhead associated (FHA) protein